MRLAVVLQIFLSARRDEKCHSLYIEFGEPYHHPYINKVEDSMKH